MPMGREAKGRFFKFREELEALIPTKPDLPLPSHVALKITGLSEHIHGATYGDLRAIYMRVGCSRKHNVNTKVALVAALEQWALDNMTPSPNGGEKGEEREEIVEDAPIYASASVSFPNTQQNSACKEIRQNSSNVAINLPTSSTQAPSATGEVSKWWMEARASVGGGGQGIVGNNIDNSSGNGGYSPIHLVGTSARKSPQTLMANLLEHNQANIEDLLQVVKAVCQVLIQVGPGEATEQLMKVLERMFVGIKRRQEDLKELMMTLQNTNTHVTDSTTGPKQKKKTQRPKVDHQAKKVVQPKHKSYADVVGRKSSATPTIRTVISIHKQNRIQQQRCDARTLVLVPNSFELARMVVSNRAMIECLMHELKTAHPPIPDGIVELVNRGRKGNFYIQIKESNWADLVSHLALDISPLNISLEIYGK